MVVLLLIILTCVPSYTFVDTEPCNACLSWKIYKEWLILTCKVKSLKFRISFIGPSHTEEAFCLGPYPVTECRSNTVSGNIKQNTTTNETFLMLNMYEKEGLDGWWMCKHAQQKGKVEVTSAKFIQMSAECAIRRCFFSLTGFVLSFIIIRITVSVLQLLESHRLIECKVDTYLDRFWSWIIRKYKNLLTKYHAGRKCDIALHIPIVIFCGMFLYIPFFSGLLEKDECSAPGAFVCLGIVEGAMLALILTTRQVIPIQDPVLNVRRKSTFQAEGSHSNSGKNLQNTAVHVTIEEQTLMPAPDVKPENDETID